MAAKGSKRPDYSKIAKIPEYFPGMGTGKTLIDIHTLDNLRNDSARIGVIIKDTIFDAVLRGILMLYFPQGDEAVKKLFEPSIGGPLVSLTHKARLAYALGLIDKTGLNDFEHIHKIRNEFAHSTEMSFANATVVRYVQKLSTAKGRKVTGKNFLQTLRQCHARMHR